MIIGNFTYDPATDRYRGQIQTLSLHRDEVELRPQTRSNDREPNYRVYSKYGNGEVECGVAWKRTSDRERDYVSVLLDDPSLARSLSAALFVDREGNANLVWSRPQSDQPASRTETKPARRGRLKPGLGEPAQG